MQHLTQLRPLRGFTQIPNAALDGLPDLNSIGLLSVVLRHDEEYHWTLDQLIAEKRRIPGPVLGRDVAYKAMRTLIAHRWVGKIRYRDAGGHFHTAVFRTVVQFSDDDYREMCSLYVEGTEMWLSCSGCDEDAPVLTRIKGTAEIECALGRLPINHPVFAQVATTTGFPEAGEPEAGGPTGGRPARGKPTVFKNNSENTKQKTGEEGEEDAHARAKPPVDDSSGAWGIAPSASAARQHDTLFARTVIAGIAEETGQGLEPWQHRRLVTELLPDALDAVARLGDDAVSGAELVAWLRWGHATTRSLYAVLSARLDLEFLTAALPAWVRENNHPNQPLQPHPERAPQSKPGPSQAPPGRTRTRQCSRHGTPLIADRSGHGWSCPECVAEPHEPPARRRAAVADLLAPPDPGPLPHCGASECHPDRRRILRWDPLTEQHRDLGPCPRCHPASGQVGA
ncbi:hypothetical protein ACFVWN_20485 [Nocardiopsis flavescens]|uniref:hypothetical protein n=1 Tax=Nocardiopsis flavescens TaxID=758803 RepID=UPI0036591E30